jgi:hypothetical protein
MKKLILLFIATCTFLPHAHAQTAQETVDWLNVKLNGAMYYSPAADDTTIAPNGINTHTVLIYNQGRFKGFADSATVTFSRLTNVSSKSGHETALDGSQVSVIGIVLTGGVRSCVQDNPCTTEPFLFIDLSSDTPPETVSGIVKAFKHLAQLQGANMVNDDLFK